VSFSLSLSVSWLSAAHATPLNTPGVSNWIQKNENLNTAPKDVVGGVAHKYRFNSIQWIKRGLRARPALR
jgi:hypothetical protein